MRTRLFIVFAVMAAFASGANKDMIELQRDVATLQDKVAQLNDKIVALTTMMQTTLDNVQRTNAAIISMQEHVDETLKRQQDQVGPPVAAVGNKLDQMSEDFRNMRETVLDMNSRIGKLDQKIVDLQNTIAVIKTPPAAPPPPTQDMPAATGGTIGSVPGGPPPGMQAETSYTNAYRDYLASNYTLAMQEFKDYVRYFPQTQLAPNAQYYVGDIYFRNKDYDNAITAFDAVLEHFSENPKTADAHLMKGRSLMAQNKRDAAAKEFKEITAKYPDSDAAAKARTLLKELGLSASSPKKKKR